MGVNDMIRKNLALLAFTALVPGLVACSDSDTAQVRIVASDVSALRQGLGATELDQYRSIVLNVRNVRLRIAGDGEREGGWHELETCDTGYQAPSTESDPEAIDSAASALGAKGRGKGSAAGSAQESCPLDLLGLIRGEQISLAWGDVPAGRLTQLRFVLADDHGVATRHDDTEVPVFVPSGSQSGLKLVGASIELEPSEENVVALEFDARASIRDHNGGMLRVRPVIQIRGAETVPVDDDGEESPAPGDDDDQPILQ